MRSRPLAEAQGHMEELADEVDDTGPILLDRPGRTGVVVVSVDDWARFEGLASEEETEWWLRSEKDRAARGEPPGAGEEGPGLDEEAVRRKYAHLLRRGSGVA